MDKKDFTLEELMNGDCFEVLSDQPLLKGYKMKETYQYTGLLDKNNTEICEGDIVRVSRWDSFEKYNEGIVLYLDQLGKYVIKSTRKVDKDNEFLQNMFTIFEDGSVIIDLEYWKEREILGNIFENTELLKEK